MKRPTALKKEEESNSNNSPNKTDVQVDTNQSHQSSTATTSEQSTTTPSTSSSSTTPDVSTSESTTSIPSTSQEQSTTTPSESVTTPTQSDEEVTTTPSESVTTSTESDEEVTTTPSEHETSTTPTTEEEGVTTEEIPESAEVEPEEAMDPDVKDEEGEEEKADSTEKELADEVVKQMKKLPRQGIMYSHNYRQLYGSIPDEYMSGHTESDKWDKTAGSMTWTVKPGEKASEALKEWIEGTTVAECYSALVALEMNTLRKQIGDERFDELYSSFYGPPEKSLLVLSSSPSLNVQYNELRKWNDYEKDEHGDFVIDETTGEIKGLAPGDWGYIYNHPKFLLKHPASPYQGENAIYLGNDKWAGLGVSPTTIENMLDDMRKGYNYSRSPEDYWRILRYYSSYDVGPYVGADRNTYKGLYDANLDKVKTEYKLVSEGGTLREEFNDLDEYIEDGKTPYTIGTTTRVIGLQSSAQLLDADKVNALKTN